jgi:hypothetical protein
MLLFRFSVWGLMIWILFINKKTNRNTAFVEFLNVTRARISSVMTQYSYLYCFDSYSRGKAFESNLDLPKDRRRFEMTYIE